MTNSYQRLVNNAVTTVAVAMDAVQTTIDVGDAARFPTNGDFHILVGTETMRVTAVSSNQFTVVRGVDGTGAATHAIGELVKAILSDEVLEIFQDEISVHGQALETEDEHRRLAVTDPATTLRAKVADFTWVNQAGASAYDRGSHIVMEAPSGSLADNLHSLNITAPAAPYVIRAGFTFHSQRGGTLLTNAPYPQAGIHFRESSTGKFFALRVLPRQATASEERWNIQVKKMNNPTSFNSDPYHLPWCLGDGIIWFKLEDDNTDLKFSVGPNGKDWIEVYSEARTTWMSGGPDEVGFGINVAEGTASGSLNYKSFMEMLHFTRF